MKVWFCLLFLTSCSLFIGGKEPPRTAKGALYSVNFSYPEWVSKEEKRSDYVFENVRDGKILLSNSFCDEFQEGTLEALALKTFQTIAEFKIQQQGYLTFQEREAFEVSGVGKVDGVTVKLQLLNTRRNNCYFDFLSITPERSKDGEGAFRNFLKAVVFK